MCEWRQHQSKKNVLALIVPCHVRQSARFHKTNRVTVAMKTVARGPKLAHLRVKSGPQDEYQTKKMHETLDLTLGLFYLVAVVLLQVFAFQVSGNSSIRTLQREPGKPPRGPGKGQKRPRSLSVRVCVQGMWSRHSWKGLIRASPSSSTQSSVFSGLGWR